MAVISSKIVQEFKDGNKTAFSTIYEETKKFIFNVVYKMVLNREEAEDLMHDIYIKIYENRAKFNHVFEIKTWIYRVAVNYVLNHQKRKKWLFLKQFDIAFFYNNQAPMEEANEEGRAMKLLEKLPDKYKMPIILKDIEELSYERIAEVLNIKIGTVRSRLNRGRSKLLALYKRGEKNE